MNWTVVCPLLLFEVHYTCWLVVNYYTVCPAALRWTSSKSSTLNYEHRNHSHAFPFNVTILWPPQGLYIVCLLVFCYRFKAAFEANNNTIDKPLSTISTTQYKSDNKYGTGNSKRTTPQSISPIRVSPDRGDDKPPPKFTSVFLTQTTVHVNENKPKRLEIKSVTPSPYSPPTTASSDGGSAGADTFGFDPFLK